MDVLRFKYTISGASLYAMLHNSQGQVWNTSALQWEALALINWADYATALTETPVGSRLYIGTIPPAIASGEYSVDYHMWDGVSTKTGNDMVVGWASLVLSAASTIRQPEAMRGTDGANTVTPPTTAAIDAELSGTHGGGDWTTESSGAYVYQVEVHDDAGDPIEGVTVRMTAKIDGSGDMALGRTNAAGLVDLGHDEASGATVYLWKNKTLYNFTNPQAVVIP